MARGQFDLVLRQLRNVLISKDAEQLTDADLLGRFVERRDEAAFTVLVRRHGRLVLNVCRHVLHRDADADDAFQATFLILARKAASVRKATSLATWLHRVAFRCAKDLRKSAMRRRKHEETASPGRAAASPISSAAMNELLLFLDEEVNCLSAKYRDAFVLCVLESKNRADAAQVLRCSEGTLASRLAKAREILQRRLIARGITLSAALCVMDLSSGASSASVSASLINATTAAAMAFAAGNTVGVVSAKVVALAQGVLQGMLVSKLKIGAALMAAIFLSVSAAGGLVTEPNAANHPAKRIVPLNIPVLSAQITPKQKTEQRPRTDAIGDPLPDGAVARLGARPFRHDGAAIDLTFTPDGKSLLGYTHSGIVIWDAATGVERSRIRLRPPHFGGGMGISPDGALLAFTEEIDGYPKVTLWDLATGTRSRTLSVPAVAPYYEPLKRLIFTPDGKSLVLSHSNNHRVFVFDALSGKVRITLGGNGSRFYYNVAVCPDSKSFAVAVADQPNYGDTMANHEVQLLDVTNGKLIRLLDGWRKEGGYPLPLAFSPDGRTLAFYGDRIVMLRDLATGEEVGQFTPVERPRDLAFTPDGTRLVYYDVESRVYVWDVAAKKTRHALDARMHYGSSIAISPDGKVVALGAHGSTVRLWETNSGKELFTENLGHDSQINTLAFSPDGKTLVSTGDFGQTFLWDTVRWQKKGALPWGALTLSFSPDGKRLAAVAEGNKREQEFQPKKLRVWDMAAGKEAALLTDSAIKELNTATFSEDGRKIFTWDRRSSGGGHYIRHWDVATGTHERWAVPKEYRNVAFAPDGQSLFATRNEMEYSSQSTLGNVVIRGLPSGQERLIGPANDDRSSRPTLSSDGRLLALAVSKKTEKSWEDPADIRVCDVATRKELFLLPGQKYSQSALAWSPDTRVLATGTDRHDRISEYPVLVQSIRLWDMATGKELAKLDGINADTVALAFSPDGKSLVAGLRDGTLLVFDAGKFDPRSKPAPPLSQAELDAHWAELASDDGVKAQKASWRLIDAGQQSLPFLRDRLKPVPVADAEKAQKWIGEVGSDSFSIRDAATKELLRIGDQVHARIHEALKRDLPLETRRRLQQILDTQLDIPVPNVLRTVRAIMVLERIGTPEARGALEDLARGAPGARATEESVAALNRLTMALSKR